MDKQNNSQKYNDIGNRIADSVKDALNTGDFTSLNADIRGSVMTILSDVGGQINEAVSNATNSASSAMDGIYVNRPNTSQGNPYARRPSAEELQRIRERNEERMRKMKKPSKRVRFEAKGEALGVLGIIFGSVLAIVGLGLLIGIGLWWSLMIAGGLLLFMGGIHNIKVVNLAKRYKKLAEEKLYVGVDAIAAATSEDKKKVIKNIKKLLKKGFFPEGFLDEEETTLMVSKEIYDQYAQSRENARQMAIQKEKEEAEAQANGTLTSEQQAALNNMMEEGMKAVGKLHDLNKEIPGEVISAKLDRLEDILLEIFARVKEHPEQMDNCRKLMEYYLPMMLKLVEAYAEYDKVSQPGPDIESAKQEIENTIDIINQAFVELLNKLFQHSVWDSTSDARVLQTMLKQDGLSDGINYQETQEEEVAVLQP